MLWLLFLGFSLQCYPWTTGVRCSDLPCRKTFCSGLAEESSEPVQAQQGNATKQETEQMRLTLTQGQDCADDLISEGWRNEPLVGNTQQAAEEVERCASGAQVRLLDRDMLREHVGAMAGGGARVLQQQLQVVEEGFGVLVIAFCMAAALSAGSARTPVSPPPPVSPPRHPPSA
mmetsp:Transcript_33982/g.76405  ORF Transcript_33982/g.76405 Transcript_33982/m.76405 type:complete len:174 (-) Transcript_33982:80-601(-)